LLPGTAGMLMPVLREKKRIAEEKWYSRFSDTAKENYKEMGLLSISIVAYTRKNGQLAIDMYVPVTYLFASN
jgi:hypothetical protein